MLGNPPYVRVHNLGESFDEIKTYACAQNGMTDLFIVFYELGIRMLNATGVLGYGQGVISPGPQKVSLEELERIIDLYDQCVDFRLKSLPVPSVSAEEFEQGIKDHIKSFVDKL